ncbi:MAG: DNA-binding transcriptional regulator [Candidatus Sericytochromatia bacterium]
MSDSILDVVHETAKGFNKIGLVNNLTMKKFDKLCLPQIKNYEAEEIKQIRLRNKISQAVFASYLNISISTIQKWESGNKKPNGTSLKLLNIVDNKGIEILV